MRKICERYFIIEFEKETGLNYSAVKRMLPSITARQLAIGFRKPKKQDEE